jgi:hypothetical protein
MLVVVIKANKSNTNPAPLEIIDDGNAGAEAEPEIIPSIPSIIIRKNGLNPDRQVIILPYERDELWQNPNIKR